MISFIIVQKNTSIHRNINFLARTFIQYTHEDTGYANYLLDISEHIVNIVGLWLSV